MANLQSLQSEISDKVQKASLPVILDFGAEWCSPCKRLAPIMERLAVEWAGKVYSILLMPIRMLIWWSNSG